MDHHTETKNAFTLLLLCSAVTVCLWFIPFAGVVTYPFRIFVTMIHETGHALAALLTLGQPMRITLNWNGSGLTETYGGIGFFISSAGYLGAMTFGAGLLLILRRAANARFAAVGTGALLVLVTLLLGGNLAAWVVGIVFGFGLLALGVFAPRRITHFFMSFLAVQSVLNSLFDLRTLMYISATAPGTPTDAQNMARATDNFIPAIVWSIIWALISLAILAGTLYVYYKSLGRGRSVEETQTKAASAAA